MGHNTDDDVTTKTMRLRYADRCRVCGTELTAGTTAVYDKVTKTVLCLTCTAAGAAVLTQTAIAPPDVPVDTVDSGTAGASARREFERRRAKRETRIREAHPRLGGLILALSDDPQSTRAWDSGALGEEALGRRLGGLADKGVRVLHDRRIRGTKANIDHIAVCPSGVHVIDAKRYAGKRPSLRVEGGVLRPRIEKLMVGSSYRPKLVEGVQWQVERVRAALDAAGLGDVPVRGTLCFVDADWPMFGGQFTVSGVAVRWPRPLADELVGPGALESVRVDEVHRALAAAFPVV